MLNEKQKIIASALYGLPINEKEIEESADRNGLSYISRRTTDHEILPLIAGGAKDRDSIIIFSESFGDNTLDFCKAYHLAIDKVRQVRFTTLEGYRPHGNVAFVHGQCICGSTQRDSQPLNYESVPEMVRYGPLFVSMGLDEPDYIVLPALGLVGDSSAEQFRNLLRLPEEERVRRFTRLVLRDQNLSDSQLARVHIIPTWSLNGSIEKFIRKE